MFALVPVVMILAVVLMAVDMKRRYLAEQANPAALTDADVDARIAELERLFPS